MTGHMDLPNSIWTLTLGVCQISFGGLLVLLDFAYDLALSFKLTLAEVLFSSGIWAGGFFIVTGWFAVLSGRTSSSKTAPRSRLSRLIPSLVFSVAGALVAIGILSLSSISTVALPTYPEPAEPVSAPLRVAQSIAYLVMVGANLGQTICASFTISKLPLTCEKMVSETVSQCHTVTAALTSPCTGDAVPIEPPPPYTSIVIET